MSIGKELDCLGILPGESVLGSGPVSRETIAVTERELGVVFPDDYVAFLEEFGPVQPFGQALKLCIAGQMTRIYEFAFFDLEGLEWARGRVQDLYGEGVVEDGALIEPNWGPFLIPFGGRAPSQWFCFDFYFDSDSPPVLEISPEGVWERSEAFDGIRYIADSLTDFMSLMEQAHETDEPFAPCEPYRSDAKSDWERRLQGWLGLGARE